MIDLLCVTPDEVEIVDYKTDRGRHAESEYRKQVSVYYHVVAQCFPDRDVSASIVYTEDDTRVPITPFSEDELVALAGGDGHFERCTSWMSVIRSLWHRPIRWVRI